MLIFSYLFFVNLFIFSVVFPGAARPAAHLRPLLQLCAGGAGRGEQETRPHQADSQETGPGQLQVTRTEYTGPRGLLRGGGNTFTDDLSGIVLLRLIYTYSFACASFRP